MEEQRLFSFNRPVEEVKPLRRTRKNRRKNAPKIPRQTLSKVEEDLKAEYRKYVNSIRRKKSCKVQSFRAFAKQRFGKKTRGKKSSKKSIGELSSFGMPVSAEKDVSTEETPVVEAPVVEAPVVEAPVVETPVEETPVVEAPVVEAPVEETPVEETPVSTEEIPVEGSPAPEGEKKPEEGGIVKSLTDTLGLTTEEPKKEGGKRHKRKSRGKKRGGKKSCGRGRK
jgi:hypothetical protein